MALSFLVVAIGLLVIVGWYSNSAFLVRIDNQLPPMRYNAALCVALCGVAIASLCIQKKKVAFVFAGLVVIISFLTLLQYIFNFNIGIDQLFFQTTNLELVTSHVDRMSPDIAQSIFIVSFTIVFCCFINDIEDYLSLIFLVCVVIFLIGAHGFIRAVFSLGSLYITITPMAVQAGFCQMLLALALFCFASAFINFDGKIISLKKLFMMHSVVARIPLVLILFTIVITGALIFVYTFGSQSLIITQKRNYVELESKLIETEVSNRLSAYREDVHVLSGLKSVQRFALVPATQNRKDAEHSFKSFLSNKPEYFQVRFLSTQGRELIRVDKKGKFNVHIVSEKNLQDKSSRMYFKDMVKKLSHSSVFFSKIGLNREHGKISHPKTATLRTASAVKNDRGEVLGYIIINTDVDSLFDHLIRDLSEQYKIKLYLLNNDFQFLIHPEGKAFSFEYGKRFGLFDEFNKLKKYLDVTPDSMDQPLFFDEGKEVFYLTSLNDLPIKLWLVIAGNVENDFKEMKQIVDRGIIAVWLLTFLIGVITIYFSRKVFLPLKHISKAMVNYSVGVKSINLSTSKKDEVGLLARSFNNLINKIESKEYVSLAYRNILSQLHQVKNVPDVQLLIARQLRKQEGVISCQIYLYQGNKNGEKHAFDSFTKLTAEETKKSFLFHKTKGTKNYNRICEILKRNEIVTVPSPYEGEKYIYFVPLLVKGTFRYVIEIHAEDLLSETSLDLLENFSQNLGSVINNIALDEKNNQAHKKIQKIYEAVPDILITIDEKGVIQEVNQNIKDGLGYAPEEVIGKNITMLMPKSVGKKHDGYIQNYLRTGEGKIIDGPEREVQARLKNGQIVWMSLRVSALKNSDSIWFIGLLRNISKRKEHQESIISYNKELEETEKKLRHAMKEATDANKAKSEFLANMSHELRTPMHAIQGFADLAISNIDSWKNEEFLESFEEIKDSSSRLLSLINDLLDLSKLEARAENFKFVTCDVRTMIDDIVRSLKTLLVKKGQNIEIVVPKTIPKVTCDPQKIQQVLTNLLSNAIKFTPEKKNIKIRVKKDVLLIDSKECPAITIIVDDEGIGVPANEVKDIFDKFVQSSKTTTGAGGTGLGLAICKEIVSGHGGVILARNKPRKSGFQVLVTLPIK